MRIPLCYSRYIRQPLNCQVPIERYFSVVSVAAAVLFHDDYLPAMLDRGNISSFISLAHLCSTIAASMNEIKLRYLYMLNHNSFEFILATVHFFFLENLEAFNGFMLSTFQ